MESHKINHIMGNLRDQFAMRYMTAAVINRGGFIAAECYQAAEEMLAERAKWQPDATPAPSGKLEEAAPMLLGLIKRCVSDLRLWQDQRSSISSPDPETCLLIQECEQAIALATGNEASEVEELPECWAIERTPENADMVNAWANQADGYSKHDGYSSVRGWAHSAPVDGGRTLPRIILGQGRVSGYTPITTDQFKRLVAKQP